MREHPWTQPFALVALGAIAILTAATGAGIWALTGRVDALYLNNASVKESAAKTSEDVKFMRSDIVDMKQTMKDMSATLQSIDKRLAVSGFKNPIGYFIINDPAEFFRSLPSEKLRGPIYIDAPNPETQSILKAYLSGKTSPAPAPGKPTP